MGKKDILKVSSKSDEKRRSCSVYKVLSHTYIHTYTHTHIHTGPLQYPFGFRPRGKNRKIDTIYTPDELNFKLNKLNYQGCIKFRNSSREVAGIKTVFISRRQINLL